MSHAILIGAPIDSGQRRPGCLMGPAAYRVAGLVSALRDLGHTVEDIGDLAHDPVPQATHPNPVLHALPETLAWTGARPAGAPRRRSLAGARQGCGGAPPRGPRWQAAVPAVAGRAF